MAANVEPRLGNLEPSAHNPYVGCSSHPTATNLIETQDLPKLRNGRNSVARREYLRNYQRRWMAARRQEWINAHGPCAKCGSSERLEVDHRNPAKKKFDPKSLWSMSPKNPRRKAELAKCQVLCHECHKVKTRPQLQEHARRLGLTRPLMRDSAGRFLPTGAQA